MVRGWTQGRDCHWRGSNGKLVVNLLLFMLMIRAAAHVPSVGASRSRSLGFIGTRLLPVQRQDLSWFQEQLRRLRTSPTQRVPSPPPASTVPNKGNQSSAKSAISGSPTATPIASSGKDIKT